MNEVDPVHAMRTMMRRYAAADGDLSSERFFAADGSRCRSSASQRWERLHLHGCGISHAARSKATVHLSLTLPWFRSSLGLNVSVDLARLSNVGQSWKSRAHSLSCTFRQLCGALLCPVFGTQRTALFYPVDTIDSDMFFFTLESSVIYPLFCYNHCRNHRCSNSSHAPFAIYARTRPPAPPA